MAFKWTKIDVPITLSQRRLVRISFVRRYFYSTVSFKLRLELAEQGSKFILVFGVLRNQLASLSQASTLPGFEASRSFRKYG